ncbi:Armadillo-like helical [Penicillium waksmanii]|uniref:Armadillo-like helical n=1 Tax=Penicillium waksmanii TaxID=69791 RepID=UPI0025480E78|nr:Armadillo-like helical [Penicillium waksmanii]KAJ6000102.1 Armadillo-like helical [Penicillium waksmanii]
MVSTLSGPSKLGRMNREGYSPPSDVEMRGMTNRCEPSGHQHSSSHHSSSELPQGPRPVFGQASSGEDIETSSNKKQKLGHPKVGSLASKPSPLEQILAKLSPQGRSGMVSEAGGSASSPQIVSTKESLPATTSTEVAGAYTSDEKTTELLRLKQELLAANSKIALQEQELAQTRVIKHTLDQALGPPSEADFGARDITDQTICHLQSAFNASHPGFGQLQDTWNPQDDSQSDVSDTLSAGTYNRARGIWTQGSQPAYSVAGSELPFEKVYGDSRHGANTAGQFHQLWNGSNPSSFYTSPALQTQRIPSNPSTSVYGFCARSPIEQPRYSQGPLQVQNPIPRRSFAPTNVAGTLFPPPSNPWTGFTSEATTGDSTPKSPTSSTTRSSSVIQAVGMYPFAYHARQAGTTLSPTATEFTTSSPEASPWPLPPQSIAGSSTHTYISPLEPLNYRRLLDKNVSCDWKYIVDKIVCSNDQQASIFLQQKLKVGTTEQKYDIIEAIASQAYPLMVNRFGNFLIQRCFEHGTSEQVVSIANAIRGNTLTLSMDPFGCHVIQKAFDCVPEENKALMVHELLRRIPETVIHRYACHVWQKLFELRWSSSPPSNHGQRSLVVQNIFENCVEEEKRPAIEEVLVKIDVLSHGQFGNWCIQHICEHGAPLDKSRATDHVLHCAVDYSMDQFASKIVEKCLKIGGSDFLDHYLSRVCTGRTNRPRMPLIDIAGDQYGNYLIQWILMNAAPCQREIVAGHIRKHMVSLRGSKFGSRVAMLCCNPSHTTRPGPGTGMQIGRFNQFNEERFSSSQQNGGRYNRGNQWSPGYVPFR